MSGHVLVLAKDGNLKKGDYLSPFADFELNSAIPESDWVVEIEDRQEFKFALEDLNSLYGANIITFSTIYVDGEAIFVGVLDAEMFFQKLKLRKAERIQSVADELKKDDPDLWAIAEHAYTRSPYYFIDVEDPLVLNEMDFLEYLADLDWPLFYVTQVFRFK